jgi:hypothetical protein
MIYPPILHLKEWEEPVPLSSVINTSGAEDSPFIIPLVTYCISFLPRMLKFLQKSVVRRSY